MSRLEALTPEPVDASVAAVRIAFGTHESRGKDLDRMSGRRDSACDGFRKGRFDFRKTCRHRRVLFESTSRKRPISARSAATQSSSDP
jgi:hypothetical protein